MSIPWELFLTWLVSYISNICINFMCIYVCVIMCITAYFPINVLQYICASFCMYVSGCAYLCPCFLVCICQYVCVSVCVSVYGCVYVCLGKSNTDRQSFVCYLEFFFFLNGCLHTSLPVFPFPRIKICFEIYFTQETVLFPFKRKMYFVHFLYHSI